MTTGCSKACVFQTDDTLSEEDSKATALSVTQTHRASLADDSCHSIPRKEKTARRLARQTQLKRFVFSP